MASSSSEAINSNRNIEDHYGVQYLGSGLEAEESETAWKKCTKYPGHVDFIPLKDFALTHLPEHLRQEEVFNSIKCIAGLTVRIRLQYASPSRLVYWSTPVGFRSSVGTGYVTSVKEITQGGGECNCYKQSERKETSSDAPQKKRWIVKITTAAHVLFNDEETKYAWVDFFFDDEEARKEKRIVSLKIVDVESVHPKEDFCEFHCVSDDKDFIDKLLKLWLILNIYHHTISESLKSKSLDEQKDVVIVSHPHGQSKHITIGKKVCLSDTLPDTLEKHLIAEIKHLGYTTPTCPGSSGAGIWCSNQDQWLGAIFRVHSMGFPGAANVSSFNIPLYDNQQSGL